MTSSPIFEVVAPGMLTTLQDQGRWGHQHLGISPCGPMDTHAAAWSNRLLENPGNAPVLEIAQGGLRLKARTALWVAVTGAEVALSVLAEDGQCVRQPAVWSRFPLLLGEQLVMGPARHGVWSYLAVAGGFAGQNVIDSVATQTREGLGGLDGKGHAIARGDQLYRRALGPSFMRGAQTPAAYRTEWDVSVLRVRFTPAHDYRRFNADDVQRFIDAEWQLSTLCSRMGYRLEGEQPLQVPPTRRWSLGVLPGAIQIVPEGYPIVLMADGQTMGGYPLLGWVHPLDRARLAQRRPHQKVRFELCTVQDIQQDAARAARFFSGAVLR